jgi:hypothetical protein
MKEQEMQSQPSILNGLVTMGLITILILWGVISLTNEDPLWFLDRFNAQAEAITIYWDGDTHTVTPQDPGYDALMEAFSQAISSPGGFEGSVAFSEAGIEQYRDRFRLLEARFSEPVQVHTHHPFPQAATYLVPLNETHGRWRRVFPFSGERPYTSGPINVRPAKFDALYRAAESVVTAQ